MGIKRKEREGEEKSVVQHTGEEHHGSTLFVTSLPYTLTSTDLETLFSDHAPVRQAFVVLDKETKVSKGVGYVSFAVREDAERLVKELERGVECQGRKVKVQWPGKKEEQAGNSTPAKPKAPRPGPSKPPQSSKPDPLAIRTLVISGLPDSISSKELWKKARKQTGAETVTYSVDGGEGVAWVVYDTPANAQNAVQALHAHTFKGCLLNVVLKKRLDSSLKLPVPAAVDGAESTEVSEKGKGKAAPNRAGRLIVRNLPFSITEQDLRAAFLPYGPLYSIEIPTLPSLGGETEEDGKKRKGKERKRGFAFVWMLSKADAQKALEGVNGRVFGAKEGKEGRTVAVDWALSKERWEKEVEAAEDGDGEDAQMDDAEEDNGEDEDEDGDGEGEGDDDDMDEEDGDENEDEEDVGEDVDEEGEDTGSEDEEDDGDDDDAPTTRPMLPQTDVGTTLFVRNIPFEATEEDLRTTFRTFGPLRYARITLDPESGRSRGTGFVCFWDKSHADSAITAAELLAAETGTSNPVEQKEKGKRINPFAMQSLLAPDPSSSLARGLVLQGRTLSVTRAVARDEATKLKEEGEKRREKEDKRNLYLMREGVIFPNTPAAATIPSAELDRRVASFNTRRALLRSNPSLYISKTRLSVRQIPTFATDRTVKRLAIHAVRAFEEEAKAGDRTGLTRDELEDDTTSSSGSKKKRGERQTAVVQAKIVRQAERSDPLSGKGRSKGYGFLELRTHADALRVLRWANNNPEVGPTMSSWWKEELEENLKKLGEQMKAEKEGEKKEELNDRIKKIKERVKVLEEGAAKAKTLTKNKEERGLIMEFSIENVQVVKRRKEMVENSREKARNRMTESEGGDADERPRKRPKTGNAPSKPSSKHIEGKRPSKSSQQEEQFSPQKAPRNTSFGKSLGGLIGKKRKERRGKRGVGA